MVVSTSVVSLVAPGQDEIRQQPNGLCLQDSGSSSGPVASPAGSDRVVDRPARRREAAPQRGSGCLPYADIIMAAAQPVPGSSLVCYFGSHDSQNRGNNGASPLISSSYCSEWGYYNFFNVEHTSPAQCRH